MGKSKKKLSELDFGEPKKKLSELDFGEPDIATQNTKPINAPTDNGSILGIEPSKPNTSLTDFVDQFTKPFKQTMDLVKKGIITEAPQTPIEVAGLPDSPEKEQRLKDLNSWGIINGLPKTKEELNSLDSEIPLNQYVTENKLSLFENYKKKGIDTKKLNDPYQIGEEKLKQDEIFKLKKDQIWEQYGYQVADKTPYGMATNMRTTLLPEGQKLLNQLTKEKEEFDKQSLIVFKSSIKNVRGDNAEAMADDVLQYFDPKTYSKIAVGAKTPELSKLKDETRLDIELADNARKIEALENKESVKRIKWNQEVIKDAQKSIRNNDGVYDQEDLQFWIDGYNQALNDGKEDIDELNRLSQTMSSKANEVQNLNKKYPELRKMELTQLIGEIYSKESGNTVFDFLDIKSERKIVDKIIKNPNVDEFDKELLKQMLAEDELKIKNYIARTYRNPNRDINESKVGTDRFENLNFGYGDRVINATTEVFKGSARGIRDLLTTKPLKEHIEEESTDKLKLKHYQLEQQSFFNPETVFDLNEKNESFGKRIKNKDAGQVNWKNSGYQIAESFGQLAGQAIEGALLGGIGKGVKALTNIDNLIPMGLGIANKTTQSSKIVDNITRVILPAYLMSYDNNIKQSIELFGAKEPWKNRIYAHGVSLMEGSTEMIGNPLEQLKTLKGFIFEDAKKGLKDFVKGLTANDLARMSRNEFKDKLLNSVKLGSKNIAVAATEQNQEGIEEIASYLGETMLAGILDEESIKDRDILKEIGDTYLQTIVGMGFMQLGAGVNTYSGVKKIANNKHYKDAILGTGRNADELLKYTNELKSNNEITEQEYKDKNKFIQNAKMIFQSLPYANHLTGNKLSNEDASNYMYGRVNELYLLEEMSKSTTLENPEILNNLKTKIDEFRKLRETSLKIAGTLNYDSFGNPMIMLPELPDTYLAKPEIIALQNKVEKYNLDFAKSMNDGKDADALIGAFELQKQIDKELLSIKQADPQTEEFAKFEQQKKIKVFKQVINNTETLEELDKLDNETEDEDLKKVISNKRSQIQTKLNSQQKSTASKSKINETDAANNQPPINDNPTENVLETTQNEGSANALESNIQGQAPSKNATGDSQRLQKAEKVEDIEVVDKQDDLKTGNQILQSKRGKFGVLDTNAKSRSIKWFNSLEEAQNQILNPTIKTVETKIEEKLTKTTFDSDDLLGQQVENDLYPPDKFKDVPEPDFDSNEQPTFNSDEFTDISFLSTLDAGSRIAKFEQLIKKIYDRIDKIPNLNDILSHLESIYGKEKLDKIRDTVISDYNVYIESLDKTIEDELYGDEIEDQEDNLEQSEWSQEKQADKNSNLTDDNSENNKEIIEQKKPIKWLGNKIASILKKLAFRNIDYEELETEKGERIFEDLDINTLYASQILNWNKFKVGTILTVRVNEDGMVYDWDKNIDSGESVDLPSKNAIPFSKLNLEKNSPEWIAKVPIEILDEDGNIVEGVYIHDLDWYNISNVADIKNQQEIIDKSKELVLELRKAIIANGDTKIKITDKSYGTKVQFPKTTKFEDLPTMNENNPQSLIGFVTGTESKTVVANGQVIDGSNIINIEDINGGSVVELRKISENEYFAVFPRTDYFGSNHIAIKSLKNAFGVYLLLNKENNVNELKIGNDVLTKEQAIKINTEFKKKGLDLSEEEDINTYIRSIVKVYNKMPDVSKMEPNRVFAIFDKGKFQVYRNIEINGELKSNYLAGGSLNDKHQSKEKIEQRLNSMFDDVQYLKPNIIELPQRMKSIEKAFPLILKDQEGKLVAGFIPNKENKHTGYYDFLKNNLKTDIKSWNIGDEDNPMYVTLIQPIIEIEQDGVIEKSITLETSEEKAIEEVKEVEKIIEKSKEEIEELKKKDKDTEFQNKIDEQLIQDSLGILRIYHLINPESNTNIFATPLVLTEEQRLAVTANINSIEGLTEKEKHDIENFILATIFKNLNAKYGSKFTKEQYEKELYITFDDYFGEKLNTLEQQSLILSERLQESDNDEISNVKDLFDYHINKFKIIQNNWSTLRNNVLKLEIDKYVDFKETKLNDEEIEAEQGIDNQLRGENEKQYDAQGFEENYKNSVNLYVKRFLFTIPKFNYGTKKPERGFMGVEVYNSFEDNFNILMDLIPGNNQLLSNKQILSEYLNSPSIPEIYQQLTQEVAKLIEKDEQLNHGLQYAMTKSNLTMKMVLESYNKRTGEYKVQLLDVNANSALKSMIDQWKNNHRVSKLINETDGEYTINDKIRTKLLNTINELREKKNYDKNDEKVMLSILSDIGIKLEPAALTYLLNEGYYTFNRTQNYKIKKKGLFVDSSGVFFIIEKFLKESIDSEKESNEIFENKDLYIFEKEATIINKLAQINKKFAGFIPTNSFRDGDKSIYAYENLMMAKQTMLRLKQDGPEGDNFREIKSQTLFDKESYILKLINEHKEIRDLVDIHTSAINAIKINGKDTYGNFEVKDLSDIDYERFAIGAFTNESKKLKSYNIDGLPLRMMNILGLVSSDKKRRDMPYVPGIDLGKTHLDLDNGRIAQGEQGDLVREFLFSQLVLPELNRIIYHLNEAKRKGVHPNQLFNQKDYNLGAQMFLIIPELNTVDIGNGQSILDYMMSIPNINLEDILNRFKDKAKIIVEKYINEQVDVKLEKWNNYFIETKKEKDGTLTNENEIVNIDFKYLTKFGTNVNQQLKGLALDYIINHNVITMNDYMLFNGDVANFAQDKSFDEFYTDNKGNIEVNKPKNPNAYTNVVKNKIGINLGKRLAMLIAPGAMLSDSTGDSYIQLFVEDSKRVSENILDLIELFYGETAKENSTEEVNRIFELNELLSNEPNNESNINERKVIIKKLQKQYSNIAAYFDIESTDAQEYTTWKEHLDIIFRQGRLDRKTYDKLFDKLSNNKELDADDKKTIFQPIKPVYTSVIPELIEGETNLYRNRTLYIKSSSFPLIPQLTKGKELNKLRLEIEKLEKESGKNIRVSYGTANKVGSVTSPLKLWNENGSFNNNAFKDVNVTDIKTHKSKHGLLLNRENFRIQQDVPFKSNSKTEDKISIGSQLMKILFSDEVKDILGQEDFDNYQNSFITWLNNEKEQLYSELNYVNGQPTEKTLIALRNLLKKEAEQRNYPKQDVDILSSMLNNNEFTIPLWLSANSNRYEAFINAIIANRLIHLKLPGASLILGSEEGFISRFQQAQKDNKIVHLANFDGKLKPNQCFIPSKFRNNLGQLIDLTSDEYSEIDENGIRRLREDKFDNELLNLTSFRIPTSGHVSGSQQEIAGFFPIEVGDLAIYHKSLTKQKGFDFDVDKENTYWLNHIVDVNGDVKVLTKEILDNTINELTSITSSFESSFDLKVFSKEEYQKAEKLINSIFDTDELIDDVYKDLKKLTKLAKKKLETKLAQNEIIKIHSKVFNSTDPRIKKKVHQVLNTDFAEKQADLLDTLNSKISDKSFSILSDEYQKEKMNLGSTGKTGIGIYSNYVTWHGLSQQTPNAISLMKIEEIDGEVTNIPHEITIGNLKSNGEFGKLSTIKPDNIETGIWNKIKRTISTAFAERQNTATDNEKLQVMGRVGVNNFTINVDSLLTSLGFDKDIITDEQGNEQNINIPYFLLSQPIIVEYVKRLKNASGQTAQFDLNKKNTIYRQLIKDFGGIELSETLKKEDRKLLTGQTLYNNITNKDNKIQQVVLDLFFELNDIAEKVTVLQSHLNIQRKGLGKSFFEADSKIENLMKLSNSLSYSTASNIFIDNVSSYVGNYITADQYNSLDDKIGYTEVENKMYFKPTTFTGVIMVNSIKSYKDLFQKYFPQKSILLQNTIDNIVKNMGKGDSAAATKIELKYEVLKEIKKYLLSSGLSIYDNPQLERERLLFDNKDTGKISLATYIQNLKDSKEFKLLINGNALLSQFDFEIGNKNVPSKIKYRNSRGEDIQEEYKYQALQKLLHENINLPTFNGEEYNTTKLVSDLVAYSFMIGGTQDATEFIKFIPLSLLQAYGIDDSLRTIHSNMINNSINWYNDIFGKEGQRFEQQFFQHKPSKAKRVTEDQLTNFRINDKNTNKFSDKVTHFEIQAEHITEDLSSYVSIYNKDKKGKGNDKYQLYKLLVVDNKPMYVRLPILGTSGVVEYDSKTDNVKSLIDVNTYPEKKLIKPNSDQIKIKPKNELNPLNIRSNNLKTILTSIINADIKGISLLGKELIQFMNNDTKIEVSSTISDAGIYDPNTNTIYINNTILNDSKKVAKTVIKEYLHSITVHDLLKYFDYDGINSTLKEEYTISSKLQDTNGKQIIKNLPQHIEKLLKLFNTVQESLKDNKEFISMVQKMKKKKIDKQDQSFSSDEVGTYGALNIFEFVSEVFGTEEFQRLLVKTSYPNTNMNMLQKFLEALKDLMKYLAFTSLTDEEKNKYDKAANTQLLAALTSTFELLEEEQKIKKQTIETKYKDPIKQKEEVDKLLNESTAPKSETKEIIPVIEEFYEFGTSYKFTVSNNIVSKGEYKQGNGEWKDMNSKNIQSKYEELKNKKIQSSGTTSQKQQLDAVPSNNKIQSKKYELFPGVFANEQQTVALDKMIEFLNSDQSKVTEFYKNQFLLKGRGGTGKTTIVKKALEGKSGVIGATVSDEARGTLQENMPNHKTVTIASLLGLVPDYTKQGKLFFRERNQEEENKFRGLGKSDPIETAKILIIDEASMISPYLYNTILKKKLPSAKIIFMGDNAQIPPIDDNGGTVESPIFELENTPHYAELTIRMRQGEESPILPITDDFATNIENIQKGKSHLKNPLINRENKYNEELNEGVLFENNSINMIQQFIKDFKSSIDIKNAIIVGARNVTVDNLNEQVRNLLFDNPSEPFVIGDVIRVNSPQVIGKQVVLQNGLKGRITNVESSNVTPEFKTYNITFEAEIINDKGEKQKTHFRTTTIDPAQKNQLKTILSQMAAKAKALPNKSFEQGQAWREFYSFKEKISDIGYNYAITAHKVQGSTYNYTYVMESDLMSFPGGDLQNNRMMYTAVSRPRKKLVIFNPTQVTKTETKPKQQEVQISTNIKSQFVPQNIPDLPVNFGPPDIEFDIPDPDFDPFQNSQPMDDDLFATINSNNITEENLDNYLNQFGIKKNCN